MQHIKGSLNHLLKQQDDWKSTLLHSWPDIVGSLSDKVHIEKIQGTTIILGVYHASWMQELYLLSPMLMQTINSYLKQNCVTAIRFKASTKRKSLEISPEKLVTVKTIKPLLLSSQQQVALEKITDPQLRSVLQEFLAKL